MSALFMMARKIDFFYIHDVFYSSNYSVPQKEPIKEWTVFSAHISYCS